MGAAKVVVLIAWIWGVLSLFGIGGEWAELGSRVFWILLVAHAVECVIFLPKLRQFPGSLGHHLVQTMLYGIFHLRSAQAAARGAA